MEYFGSSPSHFHCIPFDQATTSECLHDLQYDNTKHYCNILANGIDIVDISISLNLTKSDLGILADHLISQ